MGKALNIAVGCVMASYLEMAEKREVIDSLRKVEAELEDADLLTDIINNSQFCDEIWNDYNQAKEN